MDFIEQVGTRYLEGKAYAAPQKLENYAKKQFTGSGNDRKKSKSHKGSESSAGEEDMEAAEEEEDRRLKKISSRSSNKEKGGAFSEKDIEIARLRGELEEARRARSAGSDTHGFNKKEQKALKNEPSSYSPTVQKLNKPSSTRALESRGFKVVGGALVADAASRRHRDKRPEHGNRKKLGRTADNKDLGVAGEALVAGRGIGRANSKSRYAAKEPIIVEAAPRSRRRVEEKSEDEDSTERSSEDEEGDKKSEYGRGEKHNASSRRHRRRVADSPTSEEDDETIFTSSARKSTRRASSVSKNNTISTPPTTIRSIASSVAPSKSSFSHKPRRTSNTSDQGSLIAPPPQIAAIRRRQRSRGRTLADAEIDTAAPESPSLRALSRRRRQQREAEEEEEEGARVGRRSRRDLGSGPAHLPVRSRSMVRESVGGEGSVVDILEVDSVGFRPRREGVGGRIGKGDGEGRGRGKAGEVRNDRDRGGGGPVVRKIETPERDRRRESEVELVKKDGGRSVYRVR